MANGRQTGLERNIGGSRLRGSDEALTRFFRGTRCVFDTLLMRRTAFEACGRLAVLRNGGYFKELPDWDLDIRLALHGDVAYLDEVLVEFRFWRPKTGRTTTAVCPATWRRSGACSTHRGARSSRPGLTSRAPPARRGAPWGLNCAIGIGQLFGRESYAGAERDVLRIHDSPLIRSILMVHRAAHARLQFGRTVKGRVRLLVKELLIRVNRDGIRRNNATRRKVTQGTLANVPRPAPQHRGPARAGSGAALHWGTQTYGEWLALSAMVAYLATLDLGMQTYVVNRLNQCHARGEMGDYTRVLHTGLLVNTAIPFSDWCGAAVDLQGAADRLAAIGAPPTRHRRMGHRPAELAGGLFHRLRHDLRNYRTIGEYPRGQMAVEHPVRPEPRVDPGGRAGGRKADGAGSRAADPDRRHLRRDLH